MFHEQEYIVFDFPLFIT